VATTKRTPIATLERRLSELEARVARIEAGRAPAGDGRAAVAKRDPKVKRCPGCGLPLRTRKGRCAACGRPLASL
jgi:ribosomal protein L34E